MMPNSKLLILSFDKLMNNTMKNNERFEVIKIMISKCYTPNRVFNNQHIKFSFLIRNYKSFTSISFINDAIININ